MVMNTGGRGSWQPLAGSANSGGNEAQKGAGGGVSEAQQYYEAMQANAAYEAATRRANLEARGNQQSVQIAQQQAGLEAATRAYENVAAQLQQQEAQQAAALEQMTTQVAAQRMQIRQTVMARNAQLQATRNELMALQSRVARPNVPVTLPGQAWTPPRYATGGQHMTLPRYADGGSTELPVGRIAPTDAGNGFAYWTGTGWSPVYGSYEEADQARRAAGLPIPPPPPPDGAATDQTAGQATYPATGPDGTVTGRWTVNPATGQWEYTPNAAGVAAMGATQGRATDPATGEPVNPVVPAGSYGPGSPIAVGAQTGAPDAARAREITAPSPPPPAPSTSTDPSFDISWDGTQYVATPKAKPAATATAAATPPPPPSTTAAAAPAYPGWSKEWAQFFAQNPGTAVMSTPATTTDPDFLRKSIAAAQGQGAYPGPGAPPPPPSVTTRRPADDYIPFAPAAREIGALKMGGAVTARPVPPPPLAAPPPPPSQAGLDPAADAIVGEGRMPGGGGNRLEIVIDPEAVRQGLVRYTDSATAANLPNNALVFPTTSTPKLRKLARQNLQPVAGQPLRKQGRTFVPTAPPPPPPPAGV